MHAKPNQWVLTLRGRACHGFRGRPVDVERGQPVASGDPYRHRAFCCAAALGAVRSGLCRGAIRDLGHAPGREGWACGTATRPSPPASGGGHKPFAQGRAQAAFRTPRLSHAAQRPALQPACRSGHDVESGGNHANRVGVAFPRTCIYRWAPGNETTIPPEPAPSDLLKATGMYPSHEKGRTRQSQT